MPSYYYQCEESPSRIASHRPFLAKIPFFRLIYVSISALKNEIYISKLSRCEVLRSFGMDFLCRQREFCRWAKNIFQNRFVFNSPRIKG